MCPRAPPSSSSLFIAYVRGWDENLEKYGGAGHESGLECFRKAFLMAFMNPYVIIDYSPSPPL